MCILLINYDCLSKKTANNQIYTYLVAQIVKIP